MLSSQRHADERFGSNRLERTDSGLSYTEFSYMLLQAYDFAHLAKKYDCALQIGGSDQWGNITAGIDLGRRLLSKQLYGMTCPLLLTSEGKRWARPRREPSFCPLRVLPRTLSISTS